MAHIPRSAQAETLDRPFTFRDAIAGMARIVSYVAEYRSEFLMLCGIAFLAAFLDPIATYFFSRIIFGITNPSLLFGFISTAVGFFLLWAVTSFFSLALDRMSRLRSKMLDEKARVKFYITVDDHVLHLPLSFHKSTNSGALWDKINRAGVAIADLFSNAIIPLAPQALAILVMLIISFFVNWIFGIIFLAGAAAYIYSIAKSAIPNARLQRKVQLTYSLARAHANDALANVRAVKDFSAEENEKAKSIGLFEKQGLSVYVDYMRHVAETNYAQRTIIFVTRSFTLLLSIFLIVNGKMSVADLVLLNAYVSSIFTPLTALSQQWWNVQNGIIALEDAEEVLREKPEAYVPKPAPARDSSAFFGAIQFDHVSFSYESGQTILDDVSFEVRPGEVVALVGESGVGKSTTMDLISAYHFAMKGSVSVDGEDIRNIPLRQLRSQIAVVPQETVLFNDTVMNNLRYGNFSASDEDIYEASRKAHCYDFIQKFPHGWDTMVGERGLKLSVGQKQRISIARAMLRNPKILILDEPTSALDAGTEKIITESFEDLMRDRTTFIIAHRLSTVRRADLILVFKDGKIIERGTHKELLGKKEGEYRRLYDLQIGMHE